MCGRDFGQEILLVTHGHLKLDGINNPRHEGVLSPFSFPPPLDLYNSDPRKQFVLRLGSFPLGLRSARREVGIKRCNEDMGGTRVPHWAAGFRCRKLSARASMDWLRMNFERT